MGVYKQDDGTFETLSQMVFTGTRYENNQNFRCEADNVVIREDIDKPIHDSILLDVRCKQKIPLHCDIFRYSSYSIHLYEMSYFRSTCGKSSSTKHYRKRISRYIIILRI